MSLNYLAFPNYYNKLSSNFQVSQANLTNSFSLISGDLQNLYNYLNTSFLPIGFDTTLPNPATYGLTGASLYCYSPIGNAGLGSINPALFNTGASRPFSIYEILSDLVNNLSSTTISALNTEVTNARGGFGNLNARFNADESLINSKVTSVGTTIGASGTSVIDTVHGTTTAIRLKTIKAGANVTVVDDGSGDIVINSTGSGGGGGSGTVTNGASDGSGTAIFNATTTTSTTLHIKSLAAGSNIALTDDGSGTVTVASTAAGTVTGATTDGGGTSVYNSATSTSANLHFKSLNVTSPITLNDDGSGNITLASTITSAISGATGEGTGIQLYDAGNSTATNLHFKSLVAGSNVSIVDSGTGNLTISSTGSGGGGGAITLTGNVTGSGTGSIITAIAPNVVTNTMLVGMAANTLKGNGTGGTASPTDLTFTQVTASLNVFSSTLKGLVPLSGGGTTTFLRADGTWATTLSGLTTNALIIGGSATTAVSLGSLGTASTVLHGNASGAPTFGSVALATDVSGTLQAAQFPALTGAITTTAGSLATTLGANTVANSNLTTMAAHTFKGNNTASTGTVLDLTATQLTAELNQFTSLLQGLVPSSSGGSVTFLRADGIWAVPPFVPVNPINQTGTTYTLNTGDGLRGITMNNAASNVITIPPSTSVLLPVGVVIPIIQLGVGSTSVTNGVGVVLNNSMSASCRTRYSVIYIEQTSLDNWIVYGDVTNTYITSVTGSGNLSATTIAGAVALSITSVVNPQVGLTYSPVLADNANLVTLANAAAILVTLPTFATLAGLGIGYKTKLAQIDVGLVTVGVGGTDVLIYNSPTSAVTCALRGKGAAVWATIIAVDGSNNRTWLVDGDIT